MYGSVEAESGLGAAEPDDLANSPSLNMWATMQPYPRYSMEGIPYQPFSAHFSNAASHTHHTPPMVPRPQADLGIYNCASVQRGLPVIHATSSSTSCSPALPGSRDRSGHQSLHHKTSGSPLRPHRDSSAYPTQGGTSIRDPSYQYQVELSSAGAHWTDS